MYVRSTAFMTLIAVEAAMLANVRAVVLGGWAGLNFDALPAEPPSLREYAASKVHFVSTSVPHEWLFPKVSCAVHHGGARANFDSLCSRQCDPYGASRVVIML